MPPDQYYPTRLTDTSNPRDLRSFDWDGVPFDDGKTRWLIYTTDGEENINNVDEAVTACGNERAGGKPLGNLARDRRVSGTHNGVPFTDLPSGNACEGRVVMFEKVWWANRNAYSMNNSTGNTETYNDQSMGLRLPCTWGNCDPWKYDIGQELAIFDNAKGSNYLDCEGVHKAGLCRTLCNQKKFMNGYWPRSSTQTPQRWGDDTTTIHKLKLLCAVPKPLDGHGHGDPHLTNIKGEHFDVMQEGNMLFLEIPRRSTPDALNLALYADIQRLGAALCGPTYITSISMRGSWLQANVDIHSGKIVEQDNNHKHAFGIRLDRVWMSHAVFVKVVGDSRPQDPSRGLPIGPNGSDEARIWSEPRAFIMQVKGLNIAVSQPKRPRVFLDVQVKGLETITSEIGGLLGIDDHAQAEDVPAECK
jgi:hypothetical protein